MCRLLELCSGYASVSRVARDEFGYDVVTVDQDPFFDSTNHCVDITTWDYKSHYSPGDFDVIWCSPECKQYSNAKRFGDRDLLSADTLVMKCLEIISYLNPDVYVIENPFSGMLKHRSFMRGMHSVRLDYCQYAPELGRKKSTLLWTNVWLFL